MSDCCNGESVSDETIKPGGAFDLIDHHGSRVTDQSYRGKFMLVYFGYTRCPEVCPRTLARLSNVLNRLGNLLGPQASVVQPLYVSVDPERDSAPVMKAYLEKDYPRFTGLTGSRENIDYVKSAYRVFSKLAPDPDDSTGYLMPHTAFTYLIGPDGRYVDHFTDSLSEEELIERLWRRLPS